MEYKKIITLRDGRTCTLRNAVKEDGAEVLRLFLLTHEQTDFNRSYADECTITAEAEGEFMQKLREEERTVFILADLDGVIVGTGGINPIGEKCKERHRADFGVSVDEPYWGLGIGTALLQASIECAKQVGYTQLELEVVGGNDRAMHTYRKAGFAEYGRNPRGFLSRYTGYQELVLMRLELDQ